MPQVLELSGRSLVKVISSMFKDVVGRLDNVPRMKGNSPGSWKLYKGAKWKC